MELRRPVSASHSNRHGQTTLADRQEAAALEVGVDGALTLTAAGAVIAATATGAAAYASQRFTSRRSAAADSLVTAIRDSYRSQFLRDLSKKDHADLVLLPLHEWRDRVLLELTTSGDLDEPRPDHDRSIMSKFDEILSWRMQEREARIRFCVIARAGDIEQFAMYHRQVHIHEARKGEKHEVNVATSDPTYHAAVEQLIRTIVSLRVPSALRPVNHFCRMVPLIRRRLVNDEDIRILIADYDGSLASLADEAPRPGQGLEDFSEGEAL